MVECLPATRSVSTPPARRESGLASGIDDQRKLRPAHLLCEHGDANAVTIEIFRSLQAAEPHWRFLEERGCLATPYQRFDMLARWQQHAGERAGVAPFIVTGFDAAGEPCFLWPFGRVRQGTPSICFGSWPPTTPISISACGGATFSLPSEPSMSRHGLRN